MEQYTVRRLDLLSGREPDEVGALFGIPGGLEDAPICHWTATPENYRPLCGCRMGWNTGGLTVWEYAMETELRTEEKGTGCQAWCDSCLEVFLAPDPDRPTYYFNYECTPWPAVHFGLGTGRAERKVYAQLPSGMLPSAVIVPEKGWAIRYRIPEDFLRETFGVTLRPGMTLRGNFQKCGDLTRVPHWGMWNPPEPPLAAPDFHRPEFFGILRLE